MELKEAYWTWSPVNYMENVIDMDGEVDCSWVRQGMLILDFMLLGAQGCH